jgi:AraC family transcriptional activator of pobA
MLKNAQDFADRQAIYVNSLSRAVKKVTGKPTTAHIAARFTNEAKFLLYHTDWSVEDIADRLGFEYAMYFHRFFKQHTDTTPLAYRQVA